MSRTANAENLPGPDQVYPLGALRTALAACGDYVYAYYGKREYPEAPFYVGRGRGLRVLTHWKNAVSDKLAAVLKQQEVEIRTILQRGQLPTVKLLAYNVEQTLSTGVYSLVERVIQDAFGIQKVWQKRPGLADRVVSMPTSTLVQVREDSAGAPVLAFDTLIGMKGQRDTVGLAELGELAGAPLLLVGLMRTFHPSYSSGQLAEMARMYWNLDRFRDCRTAPLKAARDAALLAWRTLDGRPTIVGAWRIRRGSYDNSHAAGRYSFKLQRPDMALRRAVIGLALEGDGRNYMGPQIVLPDR